MIKTLDLRRRQRQASQNVSVRRRKCEPLVFGDGFAGILPPRNPGAGTLLLEKAAKRGDDPVRAFLIHPLALSFGIDCFVIG